MFSLFVFVKGTLIFKNSFKYFKLDVFSTFLRWVDKITFACIQRELLEFLIHSVDSVAWLDTASVYL